jgi:hypothetical protein
LRLLPRIPARCRIAIEGQRDVPRKGFGAHAPGFANDPLP